MAKSRGSSGGFGKVVLGFVLAMVVLAVAVGVYFRWGPVPVATADKPFPMEKQIVQVPLQARIAKQMQTPPFGIGEDVYEGGARVYKADCAECHGTPGQDVAYAKYMYPAAPQLWKKHTKGNVVGVSDDQPGETYWKVANGIRLTGMPAFNHVLTDTQMWQVTLLLKNADQQLPDPVMKILTGQQRIVLPDGPTARGAGVHTPF
jgi:mono/diheme cytochrome c family protein